MRVHIYHILNTDEQRIVIDGLKAQLNKLEKTKCKQAEMLFNLTQDYHDNVNFKKTLEILNELVLEIEVLSKKLNELNQSSNEVPF